MKQIKMIIALFTLIIFSNVSAQVVYPENQQLYGVWEYEYQEDGEDFIFRVMLDKQHYHENLQKAALRGNYELVKIVNGEEERVYSSIPYELPQEKLDQVIDIYHVFGGFTYENGTILRGRFQELHTGGSSRHGDLEIELIETSPTPKIHWQLKHSQGLVVAHEDPNTPTRFVVPQDIVLEKVE
ncbi:MAG: DUF6705 family protein [Bacteroidota bacterium]